MTSLKLITLSVIALTCYLTTNLFGQNQTATYSQILPETDLPFTVEIELANLTLPAGIHSGAFAVYKDKWIFLAGRTNGLHGFGPGPGNFPPQKQNTMIFIVDLKNESVIYRSITDPTSGLSQQQIDQLSVTSPQSYQKGKTLYMTGGYGIDSSTGQFSTKDVLTAFDVPGVIKWVEQKTNQPLVNFIRQLSDPIFQVTGGYMAQVDGYPTLLIFGQNFQGYYSPNSNGDYTQQVRRFNIIDSGKKLDVEILPSIPQMANSNYRRRDLNVMESISYKNGKEVQSFIALAGVFTPNVGIWTIPVEISAKGKSHMENPYSPFAFKQGMNIYVSAALSLYSKKTADLYMTILGGITYEYYQNGVLLSDPEFPFTNEVTTIKKGNNGAYFQYLMSTEYPFIISEGPNAGNPLLFGAAAYVIPSAHVKKYSNGVIKLDKIHEPKVIGYIIGGIQSTLPNTNSITDSTASNYIFRVILNPLN